MPLPLYSRGKSPQYPSVKRLGGLQRQLELYGEEKNFFLLPGTGNRILAVQNLARRCTD
jgi:hypothetical protein